MTTEIFFRKPDFRWAKTYKAERDGKCRLSSRTINRGESVVFTAFRIGAKGESIRGVFSRRTVRLLTGGSLLTLVNRMEGEILCPTGWHRYSYHDAKSLMMEVKKQGQVVTFATKGGERYDFCKGKNSFHSQNRTWTVQQVMSYVYPLTPFLVGGFR